MILFKEVYHEEISKDNIRCYAGSGNDSADEVPGAVYLLPYLCRNTSKLYAGVAGGT